MKVKIEKYDKQVKSQLCQRHLSLGDGLKSYTTSSPSPNLQTSVNASTRAADIVKLKAWLKAPQISQSLARTCRLQLGIRGAGVLASGPTTNPLKG